MGNSKKTLNSAIRQPQSVTIGASRQIDWTRIARLVSAVLHPFLVSPLSIILILYLETGNMAEAMRWAALCAAFVVAPASIYLYRKLKHGEYTDADVSVREHRYGFYIFGAACMAACFAVLVWFSAPMVLLAGFGAALCAAVVATIINRLWTKVSIHSGAMAGVAAAAAFYSWPLALALAFGTLAVSWARLITNRHTLTQAILGWVVAIICVVLVFAPLVG